MMRDPDPDVIRMIADGLRLQVWGVPPDVTVPRPEVPDRWIEKPAEFRSPSDYGYESHRRSDSLDDDEPAARRAAWDGTITTVMETLWPV